MVILSQVTGVTIREQREPISGQMEKNIQEATAMVSGMVKAHIPGQMVMFIQVILKIIREQVKVNINGVTDQNIMVIL